MADEEAEWVREHAWTEPMLRGHERLPRAAGTCACQSGLTWHCLHGSHHHCHRAEPLPAAEGYLTRHDTTVVDLPAPYRHPILSATGRHYDSVVLLWLADRVCAWQCPCECHDDPVQLDLFEERNERNDDERDDR